MVDRANANLFHFPLEVRAVPRLVPFGKQPSMNHLVQQRLAQGNGILLEVFG
ncbi:MAG: hypothetical protein NVSMB31_20110 [Vulcanimicrobiaceae bacterium]